VAGCPCRELTWMAASSLVGLVRRFWRRLSLIVVATVAPSLGLGGYGAVGSASTTNLGALMEGYGLCLSWRVDGHVAGFSYGRSVMSWQLSSWLRSTDRRGDDWLRMSVSSLLLQWPFADGSPSRVACDMSLKTAGWRCAMVLVELLAVA
jgi:hypothetical protein